MKKKRKKKDLMEDMTDLLIRHYKGKTPRKAFEAVEVLSLCLCTISFGLFGKNDAMEAISSSINRNVIKFNEINETTL